MRIELERSGGFAGLRRTAVADDSVLPPDEARALRQLVDGAGLFELPPAIRAAGSKADRFQFRLSIDEAGRRHAVELDEAAVPARLWPLIQWLMRRGAPGAP